MDARMILKSKWKLIMCFIFVFACIFVYIIQNLYYSIAAIANGASGTNIMENDFD